MSENASPNIRKRYRSKNGQPRTYFDKCSGRYFAPGIIHLPNGKRKLIRGSGVRKSIAEANRDKLINKYMSSIHINNHDLSFIADYCQHWLDKVKPTQDLKRRTRVGYQNAINSWIKPKIGGIKVAILSREDIQNLYNEMSKAGKSRSSMNQVSSVLSQSLDEALASGHIQVNVARLVKLPRKRKPSPIYLRYEEIVLIKRKAIEWNQWLRWALALLIGMRQGECLGLRWSDVSFEESCLRIRHSQARVPGQGLVLEELKTSSSMRNIPLPPEILELFRRHKRLQLENRLAAGSAWIENDLVFTTKLGLPIDNGNDRKAWDKLLLKAGVRAVKLHAARHSAATQLLAQGNDLLVISKILGHSTIQTTAEYYAHVQNDMKLEAIKSYCPELLDSSIN
jgi:integrase